MKQATSSSIVHGGGSDVGREGMVLVEWGVRMPFVGSRIKDVRRNDYKVLSVIRRARDI